MHPDPALALRLSFSGSLVELCLSLVASPILGPGKLGLRSNFAIPIGSAHYWTSNGRDYWPSVSWILEPLRRGLKRD